MAKIGRNDPCLCGSGKKYKRCHGGLSEPNATFSNASPPAALEVQRRRHQGEGRPSNAPRGHARHP
ncbi:MAG: hypothetical protein COR54_03860 [Elusimicrobia bacterium CG22_combo_CG10-13_8_21_14_all_63_91]|nr:MAG: hypothetical protein COR54_03860 [Elusimicrobia bacterium CG22_combo_CG10-13_8_21_14_all_63_91]